MLKIFKKGDWFSSIEVEIDTKLLRSSTHLISEWNSNHSYDDRIDLSDVFQYVFEKSDLNEGEEYILEHFKKDDL
jgi:hypothetical protein